MIIIILKVVGIIMLFFIILMIVAFTCRNYFEAKPNYMVSDSYGIYCNINNEKVYYEVTTNRDNPNNYELNEDAKKIIKEMQIDINKYTAKEKIIKDIKKYVLSHDGNCD